MNQPGGQVEFEEAGYEEYECFWTLILKRIPWTVKKPNWKLIKSTQSSHWMHFCLFYLGKYQGLWRMLQCYERWKEKKGMPSSKVYWLSCSGNNCTTGRPKTCQGQIIRKSILPCRSWLQCDDKNWQKCAFSQFPLV